MRLYKYLDAQYGLWDINERKIKISLFHEMNDPFELRGIHLSSSHVHDILISDARKRGVLCLSSDWRHPVLWSHYSDKHQGICLGFDIGPKVQTYLPNYVESRQSFEADILLSAASDIAENGDYSDTDPAFCKANKIIERLLLTKFKAWEYESEARIFMPLQESQKLNGNYFAEFDEEIRLSSVILGQRCSKTVSDVEAALNGYAPPVEIIQAVLSPTSFTVIDKRNL